MTIYYQGYQYSKGTNQVHWFVTDMYILTFYTDKPIESFSESKEQVELFESDKTKFD